MREVVRIPRAQTSMGPLSPMSGSLSEILALANSKSCTAWLGDAHRLIRSVAIHRDRLRSLLEEGLRHRVLQCIDGGWIADEHCSAGEGHLRRFIAIAALTSSGLPSSKWPQSRNQSDGVAEW